MFTGIVETTGTIEEITSDQSNYHFKVISNISNELKVDQSIAHDGVCLTVTACNERHHMVTAIKETLDKTSLQHWKEGEIVNLERCMIMNGRLDGHIVQGHVDTTGKCIAIQNQAGSWLFTFAYSPEHDGLVISKGSITVNGTSLTVINPEQGRFSVAIIPYTYEHTKFNQLKVGDLVNLEFDILGKYILKNLSLLK